MLVFRKDVGEVDKLNYWLRGEFFKDKNLFFRELVKMMVE